MKFYKLQASGNDFILIDSRALRQKHSTGFYKSFAKKHCQRQVDIGADGLLVVEPSKKADFKMRIFNSDGSEAEMCGNGARCTAYWAQKYLRPSGGKLKALKFETKAGIIEPQAIKSKAGSKANWEEIKIKMTEPFDLVLDFPIDVFGKSIKVNFINTGVPHVVIFVEGLEAIDVKDIGRAVRFHEHFSPAGANVNFVEFKGENSIKIRTYERGVEGETLGCGTGSVASAVISWLKGRNLNRLKKAAAVVKVETRSRETLKVCFDADENKIDNVWLQGRVYLVYEGNL